jgi:hypothetical protein
MGQSIAVDPTSSIGCCSMSGVSCSGSKVTRIDWSKKQLTGKIPASIGNLVDLQEL